MRASDFLRAIFRHRKKMLLFFVLVLVADVAWVAFGRRTYESAAKLYLRVGRESLTLDPSATTGQTVQLYQTLDNQINSTLQILEGRHIAEQVVDEIGVGNILAGTSRSEGEQAVSDESSAGGSSSTLGWLASLIFRL